MSAGILIHAPREGSDLWVRGQLSRQMQFLSTLPARGATGGCRPEISSRRISIHAPREGSDLTPISLNTVDGISIHAPREGSDKGSFDTLSAVVRVYLKTQKRPKKC